VIARSRQGTALLVVGLLLLGALVAVLVGVTRASATPSPQPLLPLSRGQLLVSAGRPPQWLPVSGRPLTVTLFSRPSRARPSHSLNAYLALQPVTRSCAGSAARDRVRPLHEIASLYSPLNLLSRGHSPFAPRGGAPSGVYVAGVRDLILPQRGAVRVCVWLGRTARASHLGLRQDMPLLNGLFAASVSALPSAARGGGGAYTASVFSASSPVRLSATTSACGRTLRDGPTTVPGGAPGSDAISFGAASCATDTSRFAFSTTGGRPLGTLSFSLAQAEASPPQVAAGGSGCELDPVTVTRLATATAYVQAVGCSVGRLLVQPFQRGIPRGAVVEAQVDGGLAEIAPRGTAVDLVLNGRPG
jgi:hypothetical protein